MGIAGSADSNDGLHFESLKVGIMGGTFNPIHLGHLLIAEEARAAFSLGKILFIPNATPPHKQNADTIDSAHRINMVKLAIEGNPHFKICTIESFGNGAEYTANTLKNLRELFPNDEFYFITGADALVDMNLWRSPQEIFSRCEVVTTMRPGKNTAELDSAIANLRAAYNAKISKMIMPLIDISSTQIRQKTAAGESIMYLVPDQVREYILEENLYM